MRCADRIPWLAAIVVLPLAAAPRGEPLAAVYQQRYAMGTMFGIIVYHPRRAEAERAADEALEEILRLESVMSHYRADSDLMKLNGARGRFVAVDPSLYDVVRESLAVSRISGGRFDITIAPMLRTWKRAVESGGRPSRGDIAEARRCVGYRKIDMRAPNRIRLRTACAEIDLGGIGKGYATDRALRILTAAGIRHALINAGGSSITAAGAPPGRKGWPVLVGPSVLLLRGRSLSTSQQDPTSPDGGDIIDPARGAPAESRLLVSVVAPSATLADALSTTLVMLSVADGKRLLSQFPGLSAAWVSPAGTVHATFGTFQLERLPRT
jgi:thiamine biosynthesis lipoprotein